jgi:hypothetical protein
LALQPFYFLNNGVAGTVSRGRWNGISGSLERYLGVAGTVSRGRWNGMQFFSLLIYDLAIFFSLVDAVEHLSLAYQRALGRQ